MLLSFTNTLILLSSRHQMIESIRDCFVTGKWDKSRDAQTLLDQDGKCSHHTVVKYNTVRIGVIFTVKCSMIIENL